jgi:hypothetical protein
MKSEGWVPPTISKFAIADAQARTGDHIPSSLGWASKMYIKIIDRGDPDACAYCGVLLEDTNRTIDHVVPRKRGGKDRLDNLCLACQPCNSRKGDMTADDFRAWREEDLQRRRLIDDRYTAPRLTQRIQIEGWDDGHDYVREHYGDA